MEQRFLLADYFDGGQHWSLSKNYVGTSLERIDAPGNRSTPDGFAHVVETRQGQKLIGYLSSHRNAAGDAPDYLRSLGVVVDGTIYGIGEEEPRLSWRRGLLHRRLEITGAGGTMSVDYDWPFHRELLARVFGDPFTFQSNDFISELVGVVRFYRPGWFRAR